MNENELIYPISINYGAKDWDVVAAIREFLTNMLDTNSSYSHSYENGFAKIFDNGCGLSKKDFIFGESSRDESQIGQFGEGLKMAMLTLLRNNRETVIETLGFRVEVKKEWSVTYDSEVMLLKFVQTNGGAGTRVLVECSREEYESAIDLFLALKKDVKFLDKDIFLPAGDVYVMGLKTSSLDSLFSYNIKDKTMVNRDRNIVDGTKLRAGIAKILTRTQKKRVIEVYFSEMESNQEAFEYQLELTPLYPDLWRGVLEKMYGGKFVCGADPQSDLNAAAMGYKVARNLPFGPSKLFLALRTPSSAEVAKNYNGEGFVEKNKILYPIDVNYCKEWTIKDAIREILSNALDTDTPVRISHDGKAARIADSGVGITKKDFIFGGSKKDESQIGQFGEGLKIASLVLARNNRQVKIDTAHCTYTATLEENAEFGATLFAIHFKKTPKKFGTTISFDCSAEELEEAKALFLAFRKKEILAENNFLDIFKNEPGQIFVNGLYTTTVLQAVFGYNVKDKTMVNTRDRNSVDVIKLGNLITEFLENTEKPKHQKLVETFLTSWKTSPHALEYRQFVSSATFDKWSGEIKALFKKSCIESFEPEHNLIAKQAGFDVLYRLPKVVADILLFTKAVPTAEKIAQKYKNKGIVLEDKIVYPIAEQYGSSWSIIDGMREILANALDTKTKVSISYEDGKVTISNKGGGIEKKNLLLGDTGKTSKDIGQFGEGLKMASLVFARNKREFRVVTKGFEYSAKIEKDNEFNANLLVFYFKKSKKREGTDVSFLASEKELAITKALFLAYNKKYEEIIQGVFKPGGYVFVNGVQIEKINSLFSYNLANAKNHLSRDRKTLSVEVVKTEVAQLIGNSSSKRLIEDFFKLDFRHFESQLTINIMPWPEPAWRDVIKKLYPKHCFASHTDYDLAAKDRGYTLLSNLPHAITNILQQMGFPHSMQVATIKGDEKIVKERGSLKSLSPEGQKKWKQVLKVFKKLYGGDATKKIEIVKTFNEDVLTAGVVGLYNRTNDTVYVLQKIIEHNSDYNILGVLIHEQVHRMSGATDRSREFENALSDELGKLAKKL